MSTSTPPSPCRLLALLGELKNRIYRLTLVHSTEVQVRETGYVRPALLSTCQQIRTEAVRIFYEEIMFHIFMVKCNSDCVIKWQDSLELVETDLDTKMIVTARTYMEAGSGNSWANFLEHMRRIHAGILRHDEPGPREELEDPLLTTNVPYAGSLLFCNMINSARTLRKEECEVVEKIVFGQKVVMEALGLEWDN